MAVLNEALSGVEVIKNYVNGEWLDSQGKYRDVINPATGNKLGEVPLSTEKELDSAVQAARDVFWEWRTTPPISRARCLFRLKELLEENFEELSKIQTQEHGKTIDESRGETRRGIENVEVATGICSLMMGDYMEDIATGIDEYMIRTPLGAFGIIGPFNFPFMIPLWSAPYAVAAGNTVVIKPSSEVPFSQMKIAELVEEAGFPPGVWNVVNGGRDVVSGMIENPGIEGITFVGSTPTAKIIYEGCGKTQKRCIAQGGAKNYILVMPDCDVKNTIPALLTSFFGNTGQRCLAGANLVVVGDNEQFYAYFMEELLAAAKNIVIGYGLDESVQMGPIRDRAKKENVLNYIDLGLQQGAKMLLDGRKVDIKGDYPETCFIGPTIFDQVEPEMMIAKDEIFGPVMSVLKAKNLDEAIELSNSSNFGNGNAIFTSNGKAAREFRYRAISGNVGINVGVVAPVAYFPFSGMKDSFYGILHTQGQDALRFFTESKVVIERWFN